MLLNSKSMNLWNITCITYVRLINCRFHLFCYLQLPSLACNIFLCFSNHLGAAFLFFLLLSLPSSVLRWHQEEGNFFLEYDESNWLFYAVYYLEMSSSVLYVKEFVHYSFSDNFIFSIFLLHHISKFTKYFPSNVLSVQVSQPYSVMVQT